MIDGSYGKGGGQILRTSLALSLITGKPFRIEKIRAGRRKPGLMRQHLTAVQAATTIGGAKVKGDAIGSQAFTFEPGEIKPGSYRFATGSAGSCTLVLQTILPALITAATVSEVILEGGTHNPFAPPFDFLARAFLPQVAKMGPQFEATLERPGFYPAGGGKFRIEIDPVTSLAPLDLTERGEIRDCRAQAVVSNLSRSIAKRELKVLRKMLPWDDDCFQVVEIDDPKGPGNIVTIEVASATVTEVFTGFGERGLRAESVAKKAAKLAKAYLEANVPVGRYLADQILLPMAMAGGGRFRTMAPSGHTLTNIEVIKSFLDIGIDVRQVSPKSFEIEVGAKFEI